MKTVVFVLMFAMLCGVASADTHTVCVAGCDFTTIQAAEDAAVAGDTVFVYNGTYTENVDVSNASVSFVGEGRDVVTVNAASSSDHVFDVTVNYVNISGFTVSGATGSDMAGISISSAQYCRISNNTASGNRYGIYLLSSSNNNITSNTAHSNTNCGIHLYSSSNHNTLTSNTAYSNTYYGIFLRTSSNSALISNNVSHNRYGIFLYSSSIHNTLTSNTACSNTDHGIYLSSSSNNAITRTNASDNGEFGIYLSSSSNNNTLTSNTADSNTDYGIYLKSSINNTLTSNNASDNRHGIYLSYSSNYTLTSNNASGNSLYGIYLFSSSNSTLTSNNASGNSQRDIHLASSSNNIIRNPTDASNDIGLDSASSLTIENTDSVAFSENSGADTRAYPNGNFSLHLSGVAETFRIVQQNMAVLPTDVLTVNVTTLTEPLKRWNESADPDTYAMYTVGEGDADTSYVVNIFADANGSKMQTFRIKSNATGFIKYNTTGYGYDRWTEIVPAPEPPGTLVVISVFGAVLAGAGWVIRRWVKKN